MWGVGCGGGATLFRECSSDDDDDDSQDFAEDRCCCSESGVRIKCPSSSWWETAMLSRVVLDAAGAGMLAAGRGCWRRSGDAGGGAGFGAAAEWKNGRVLLFSPSSAKPVFLIVDGRLSMSEGGGAWLQRARRQAPDS